MNLAAFRYRDVITERGGPICRLSTREIGGGLRESYAFLREELRPAWVRKPELYGDPDGTGTATSQSGSCHKAISEALERWAFYATVERGEASLGFDRDPTTTGMAAFPDLTGRTARAIAFRETLERWAICAWWEGSLRTRAIEVPGFLASEVLHPVPGNRIALLATLEAPYAYGFACEREIGRAAFRARSELRRSRLALERLRARREREIGSAGPEPAERSDAKRDEPRSLRDPMDRRVQWFATEKGHREFRKRLEESRRRACLRGKPPIRVDRAIPGPWSRYAAVHRVQFEERFADSLTDREDYFLF